MQTTKPPVHNLTLRPYAGEADVAEIVRVANAEFEADGVPERYELGDIRAWYSESSEMFEPERDVTLAYVGGRLVGLAERQWVDTRDGEYREYRLNGEIDPRHRPEARLRLVLGR